MILWSNWLRFPTLSSGLFMFVFGTKLYRSCHIHDKGLCPVACQNFSFYTNCAWSWKWLIGPKQRACATRHITPCLQSWRMCSASLVFIPFVLHYSYAGILSAYGLALADVVHEAQEPCAKVYSKGVCQVLIETFLYSNVHLNCRKCYSHIRILE